MADDHQFNTSNNWCRYEAAAPSSSSSSTINNSFGWPNEMVDIKARPSLDSASEPDNSSVVFHNPQKLQGPGSTSLDLQMIDLGLSSHSMDWNQALLRGDKTEPSFRSILQDNMNYQQINRGFSLDQAPTQFSPHGSSSDQSSAVTCQGLPSSNFQMDSSSLYGSPSTMLQGFFGSDNSHQQQQQSPYENHHHRSMNYQYGAPNYGMSSTNELVPNSWSKVPQFLRSTTSPPKQQSQLPFSNNAAFWNTSASAMTDGRPGFFPTLQPQFPAQSFNEKPKNISHEAGDSSSVVKKSSSDQSASKRTRNENSTPLPPFKVRKEKMGDRITALQQLVSPFGKTDTASVLSEAIEYIKFLHEQVLSTPYMKSGAPIHQQQQQQQVQSCEKSKDGEGPKQDLRSRGLCLVPISSTFPVTHETAVDFWTPTFGGTFR
ncbi:transcription factor bHLH123-like isoform X3 [Tripterygium wilfordii]|uniref:transcription factor bHLH123-like isoform X3 n=1 Tax=Tripterygium wilfordii TaxID=458696 RepID=UPI0018F7F7C4|nr:transcription factor bHLH123-like isoform X3 [Tripterygium wilfordii]